MNRAKSIFFKVLLAALPITGTLVVAEGVASAQYPPPEYIATATPEYYEGHAAYYYNNQWYYRNGSNWAAYHSEPTYLRDRRAHWSPERAHPTYRYRR